MVKPCRYVTQYAILVILSESLLPLAQVEKVLQLSTNLIGEVSALVQVVFGPPQLVTQLELVVFPLRRLSHSFHILFAVLVLLVCATQGGYDRLFSTTNRHWESQEAMHQKLVATDVKQMVAESTLREVMSLFMVTLVFVLQSFVAVELL